MPLSKFEKDFLNFIEQYWYSRSMFPPDDVLEKYASENATTLITLKSIAKQLEKPLANRGIIDRTNASKFSGQRLTDEQLAAVNMVVNYVDKRSLEKKLKALGVSPTKWQGWLKDEVFAKYLRFMTNEMLSVNLHAVNNGLIKAAENGNVRAGQFVYEVTGMYKKDSPVANIQLLLINIIEVIQKHVHDPQTLQAISKDFELVMLRTQANQDAIEANNEVISQPVVKKSNLSPALANRVIDPDDLFG